MKAEPVCAEVVAECRCRNPLGHDGPHDCRDQENCGGRWLGSHDGDDFEALRIPGTLDAEYGTGVVVVDEPLLSPAGLLEALFPEDI